MPDVVLPRLRRAFGLGAAQAVTRLICSFISIKLTAAYLGPSGLALVAQFNNLVTLGQGLAGSAATTAIVRMTPELAQDPARRQLLWATAARIAGLLALGIALLLVLFSGAISQWAFGDAKHWGAVMLCAGSLLVVVVNGILLSVLNGLGDIARVVRFNMAASVAGLVVFAPACMWGGLQGGFVGSALAYTVALLISVFGLRGQTQLRLGLLFKGHDADLARRVWAFFPMLIAHATLSPLSTMVVRESIMDTLDTHSAGLWQAAWRLSEVYLTVITTSVSLYFMPRLGELASRPAELRQEVWRTLATVTLVTALIATCIGLLRQWVVPIVFSSDFSGAQALMPLQLVGDVLRMAGWTLGFVLVALVRTRWYLAIEIAVPLLFVLAVDRLIPGQGVMGAVWAYVLASGVHLVLGLLGLRTLFVSTRTGIMKRSTLPTFWLPLLLALGLAAFIGLAASVVGGPVTAFLFVPLLAVAFVFRDYRVGVVCLAFLLPWSSSPLIPQARGLNVVNYLLVATVLSFGFRFLKVRFDFVAWPASFFKYFLLPLTVGLVVAMPHIGIAAGHFAGTDGAIGFQPMEFAKNWYIIPMGYVAFALLLANAVKESKNPERFVVLFLSAGLVPAVVVLGLIVLYGVSLADLQGQRNFMRPIGMHANEMAALLAFVTGPILFVMSAWKSIFAKMLTFLIVIVVLTAQLLTFSRGGLIASVVILTIYIFQRRHILLLLGGLILMVSALLFAPPAFKDRWMTGVNEDAVQQSMGNLSDPLTAGRVAVWERLLPEVKKSPVWGRGVASTAWSDLVRSGVYRASHPHNMYLALLLDLGIVGFALVAYWYRLLIQKQLQLQKDPGLSPVMRQFFAGSLAALVGVLVMNVTNGNYVPRPEYTFHWFSIGMVFALWSVTRDPAIAQAAKPKRVPMPWQLGR